MAEFSIGRLPFTLYKTNNTRIMPDSTPSLLNTALREPTLHFIVIAALVFIGFAWFADDDSDILELDGREIEARLFMAELNAGRELSEEQQQAVVNSYVEEQILVAEARAMNLDDDARIHDILAQKMRHILSADVIQPSPDELEEFYAANAARYQRPATVTVDELVFDSRDPLPDEVIEQLVSGAEPGTVLSDLSGNVSELAGASHLDLANIFSEEFADQIFAAETDQWQGPFMSNRGQHWLRIKARRPAEIPTLDSISERVRLEWIASEEENRLQEQIDQLRQGYTIVVTGGEER